MSTLTPLYPRQPVPDLQVSTTDGGTWRLSDQQPERFSLLVFYRGLHCPICSRYLPTFEAALGEFAARGITVVALSSDTRERALESKTAWKLPELTLGYGLSLDDARAWGLYVSAGRGKTSTGVEEPALFSEPGLFLVRPDGTLFFGSVQTMPFTRPSVRELVPAIDFVIKNDYPARGEVVGDVAV